MPHVLKVAAIKLSAPVALVISFKAYDLSIHKSFCKRLHSNHDEQHFELRHGSHCMWAICR